MIALRPLAGSFAKTTCSCSAASSKRSAESEAATEPVTDADMDGAYFLLTATVVGGAGSGPAGVAPCPGSTVVPRPRFATAASALLVTPRITLLGGPAWVPSAARG